MTSFHAKVLPSGECSSSLRCRIGCCMQHMQHLLPAAR